MALVTHPIYAKDWSFSSSTSSFDATSPYSLAESTSAVQSSNNKKSSNKRRAQELGLEWDEEDRRISVWSHATAPPPPSASSSTTTTIASSSTAPTSTNASKKAKLSDSEESKDVSSSIPDRSIASAAVSPKMEHVLLFLVDALTNVCAPAPPNQSSSPAPSPSQSPCRLLLPASPSTSQPSPLASEPVDDVESKTQPTATCEEPDATSHPQPQTTTIQTPTQTQAQTRARVRPIKSLTPPTSPLSDSEDRAPYVRKAFVVRQACSARSEQKLGRWVLAKNHFLSVRCLDPRTQSIEWQHSLRNIGWEPLHPYFQAQAEAEFEAAAAAAAAAEAEEASYSARHHHHHHFNNTLSEWIEDDFDADAEYENESEYDVEGDEDWGNEDDEEEEEDEEFELPRQNALHGAHTGVWDSGVYLTPTSTLTPQKELSLDDCRC